MLAFELFLKNRNLQVENAKLVGKHIRKAFVKWNGKHYTVELDPQMPDEAGAESKPYMEDLRLIPGELANLPDKGTGSNSPKPYVVLYGRLTKRKLELSLAKKGVGFRATLDKDMKQEIKKEGVIKHTPEKEITKIEGELIYELYEKNKILEQKGETILVNQDALEAVAKEFFKQVQEKTFEMIGKPVVFQLYLIPKKGRIVQESKNTVEEERQKFVDSFGNECSRIASSPTQTAKFLSFDEPGFSLNMRKKKQFYENLGIGAESLEKIELPAGFPISGLNFIFYDIENPDEKFEDRKSGFYDQVFWNYQQMTKNERIQTQKRGELKTMVLNINQSKKEVLVDANLTFNQLEKIFVECEEILKEKKEKLRPDTSQLFEQLIIKDGKKTIWNDYLWAIRSFLFLRPVDRRVLLLKFLSHLKRKRKEFLENKEARFRNIGEARQFFDKTKLLMKILCRGEKMSELSKDEEYAYQIGKIAGAYIAFKRSAKETPNSLLDILTYSKYDEAKLRNVYERVSRGLFLSNAEESEKKEMQKLIKENAPTASKLEKPGEDYSYFFYKGVFEKIEG